MAFLNSVKVVMDADPRGSASGKMLVANSVPIVVTDFDLCGGTRRGVVGPSRGSWQLFVCPRTACDH